MKWIVVNVSLIFVLFMGVQQAVAQKTQAVEIKTSAQCEMCKAAIEKALLLTKGVKSADLDVDTKILTINFDPKKTTVDKLKTAITKVGYDADDKKADAKKYQKLDNCCKKPEDRG